MLTMVIFKPAPLFAPCARPAICLLLECVCLAKTALSSGPRSLICLNASKSSVFPTAKKLEICSLILSLKEENVGTF